MTKFFPREKCPNNLRSYIQEFASQVYRDIRIARMSGEYFHDSRIVRFTGSRVGLKIETIVEFSTSPNFSQEDYSFGDACFLDPYNGRTTHNNGRFFLFTKGRMFDSFFKQDIKQNTPLFSRVYDFDISKKLLNKPLVEIPLPDKPRPSKEATIHIPDPLPVSNVSPKDIRLMRKDIKRRATT